MVARAIIAYLESAGRPAEELRQTIHRSHIEPFQPPELNRRSFHIVLDIEKDMLQDPDLATVEHEVHRVRRAEDGTFEVSRIRNPVGEQNLCEEDAAHFTDTIYPWGK